MKTPKLCSYIEKDYHPFYSCDECLRNPDITLPEDNQIYIYPEIEYYFDEDEQNEIPSCNDFISYDNYIQPNDEIEDEEPPEVELCPDHNICSEFLECNLNPHKCSYRLNKFNRNNIRN